MNIIKEHLKDNTGSAYMEKMILIVIAFIVGGLLVGGLWAALNGSFSGAVKRVVQGIFNW